MEETTFQIQVWEESEILALAYRIYGGGRERTWFAVPNADGTPAVPLSTILNGTEPNTQGWLALDNSNQRLHDGTLDSFAAWVAEVLTAPVVVYEVDGEVGGRWPANPNIAGQWWTNPLKRNAQLQGVRYSAVEEYSFGYSTAAPTFDAYPAQRVSVLYAMPVSTNRPAPFPIEIPLVGAEHPLEVGQASDNVGAPTYATALYDTGAVPAVLQYYFFGQWVQRFALSQPFGVLFGVTSSTQDAWTNVAPPFDGLGAPPLLGFRVTNLSEGNLSIRFGPGSPVWDEPVSENGQIKYGATHGLKDATPLVMTPSNRLQVKADGASLNYRIEYWFAPNGKGGCGCGG